MKEIIVCLYIFGKAFVGTAYTVGPTWSNKVIHAAEA